MDSTILRKLLKSFKCFKGVFPCNLLPYNHKLPLRFVVNTDPYPGPGIHWVVISIDEKGAGFYFDSFGLPPFKKEIFDYLEARCEGRWNYNTVSLQHWASSTCGHYCAQYVISICQNLTHEHFISQFTRNPLENDRKMREIYGDYSLVKRHSI